MQSANANRIPDAAPAKVEVGRPASHFRDTVTIQSLVAPVSEEEFRARYWEKKPLIVHREDPGYYGDLFTLKDFDESITRGPSYVKTAEATAKKQARYQGATPTALEKVMADMREGHTLILDAMHGFDPKLKLLCGRLGQETGQTFQTNIYLTPPNGKGFGAHWDNHDVFVLQVLGSKHWKVEKNRRAFPDRDASIEEEGREFRGDVYEFTLQQGDMVYIPRGYVHAAECGSENSMHITLGALINTWDDLLIGAVRAATLQDEGLRHALPLGYMRGDGSGIVKRMQEVFRNMADPAFLTPVLERFRDEIVTKAPLSISGQIEFFFERAELKIDDKVKARPGVFYTIRKGEESVTLNVGTRTITFPGFFGEALEFALNSPGYAIRDLPGDLGDEERLVFIERLMQETLVVRQ
ncbi:MAG TPA: cupin domain-containing protein [Rhizomicrobium sp.]|nr:cupin domain-containing protein [Rhizomicrobium sp.]